MRNIQDRTGQDRQRHREAVGSYLCYLTVPYRPKREKKKKNINAQSTTPAMTNHQLLQKRWTQEEIYIYIERERERERRDKSRESIPPHLNSTNQKEREGKKENKRKKRRRVRYRRIKKEYKTAQHTYTHTHTHTHIHTHTYTPTYTYIHTYIHTYTIPYQT